MEDVNTVFWKIELLASSWTGRVESSRKFGGSGRVTENVPMDISALASTTYSVKTPQTLFLTLTLTLTLTMN